MSNDRTLAETLEYFEDHIAEEDEAFEQDIPDHAESYITRRCADLVEAVTMTDMAFELAEEEDTVDEEEMRADIEESAVDVLLALVSLQYERDLDIAAAVEERIDFMEDYAALQEALEDAEGRAEEMEAVDEHMTEALEEEMGQMGGPSIGQNVDAEGYEHDDSSRSFH